MNQKIIDRLRGQGISPAEFIAACPISTKFSAEEKTALLKTCHRISSRSISWTGSPKLKDSDFRIFINRLQRIAEVMAGIKGQYPNTAKAFSDPDHQWDGYSYKEEGKTWYTAYDENGNPYETEEQPSAISDEPLETWTFKEFNERVAIGYYIDDKAWRKEAGYRPEDKDSGFRRWLEITGNNKADYTTEFKAIVYGETPSEQDKKPQLALF